MDQLRDFRNFLFLVWSHLNLPAPTPVQYDIAHYLQHGPRRMVIEAFRGVGKSWITAAFVCWLLLMNPEERILVVSANQDRATAFSIFVKRLIADMPILQHLQSRDGQRTSNIAFDVGPASNHQAPSVKSVGITGQIAGSRATKIVADDVEIPTNSDTVAKREKLAEAIKEFDAVLVPGGSIYYLGTPQTEESIYNKRLPDRGYEIRIWPARVPTEAQAEKYGRWLAPFILDLLTRGAKPGSPTDPKRFTETDLMERELSYGRSGFALQFMLDTNLSDAERYPLRCSDLSVLPCAGDLGPVKLIWAGTAENVVNDLPILGFQTDRWYKASFVSKDWADWQGCVMALDPSGRGRDELGYAIVRMLNGNLFLVSAGGLTGGYSRSNLEKLAKLAQRFKVKHVIIESNFGDGMFTALFKPVVSQVYPVTLEEVRHSTQKEKRIIDTLEPVMNQHRLIVDPEVIRRDAENYNEHPMERATQYSLFYQLTHITREKGALVHDDRVEAVAMAVAYWVEQMAKDDHEAVIDFRRERMRQALQDFEDNVFGPLVPGPHPPASRQGTWMTARPNLKGR